MNEYLEQANDFLAKTNTTLNIEFKEHNKHLGNDDFPRDIYTVTIRRGNRSYTFDFGQSINNSMMYKDRRTQHTYYCNGHRTDYKYKITENYLKKYCTPVKWLKKIDGKVKSVIKRTAPNVYDILATLERYCPETFEDFCSEFGYDEDSRSTYKIYKAVKKQYDELCKLYTDDELDLMAEIQ